MQFHNIRVMQLVVPLHRLTFKDTGAPDAGEFQCVLKVLMNIPGQVKNGAADRESEGP